MNHELKSEFIHADITAPVVVIFGGNPEMRHHVVTMLSDFNKVTAYAELSEDAGLQRLRTLPKVDLVLIGGRYTTEQRIRIKQYLKQHHPDTQTSEPGYDYPYGDEGVRDDLRRKLQLT